VITTQLTAVDGRQTQLQCEVINAEGGGGRATDRARLDGDERMTGWEALAVATAGFCGGGINTVVGLGTLVTFPVLVTR
jgi:hypothetical protein